MRAVRGRLKGAPKETKEEKDEIAARARQCNSIGKTRIGVQR